MKNGRYQRLADTHGDSRFNNEAFVCSSIEGRHIYMENLHETRKQRLSN